MERLTNTIRKRTLSTKDAAERLGIDQRSVGEAITRGALQATRYKGGPGPQGFSYRITASDLNKWQRSRQKRWAGSSGLVATPDGVIKRRKRKRRVVKKTRTTKEFVPTPISDFDTPLLDALPYNRIAGGKVGSVPKPSAADERKAKDIDWSKARVGAFKMTMTHQDRAIIRFKCEKCAKPFIGLMEHRDLVPTKCSRCEPPVSKWKTTSEWLAYPKAGIALAK